MQAQHNDAMFPLVNRLSNPVACNGISGIVMPRNASDIAVPAAAGGAVASSASPKAAAAAVCQEHKVTRAIERCDKFGGSVAILDEDQEAWLFDCSQLLSPIDPSTASRGRSLQSRPWQLKILKPTFCESITEFCISLLMSSVASRKPESKASKNVSVMHSVELDAVLHRCGTFCLVIHGNGEWATCHASHIPSSFTESSAPPPLAIPVVINSLFPTPLHVGSWDGCGGNVCGVSACAGFGNCSPQCVNCGARSHWTCCGSDDKDSKTCTGAINTSQATENDRLFRLVVRAQPVPCRSIRGLSGGQFSAFLLTSAPTFKAPAAGQGAAS